MLRGVIHPQNLVPVVAFLRGKVSLENQVCPSSFGCHPGYSQAEHIHQPSSGFISIEGCHDFGSLWQLDDDCLDQARLFEIRFACQAGIAGLVRGIREQGGVGQRVNGTFG